MIISSFGISDTGLVRQNNEDVWGELTEDHFFALADGMGGHLAGEVAAREAVNILCRYVHRSLQKKENIALKDFERTLNQAIRDVNTEIFIKSTVSEDLRGMGTTLSCLYLHPKGVVIGHVGDSRIYLFRNQQLSMLTQDHSLVSELVTTGRMDEEEADESKYKNVITKAVGTDPLVEPDIKQIDIQKNDVFLICSDGLTDLHTDEDVEEILKKYPKLQDCAQELVASSLSRGGVDNVTVILIRVDAL